MQNVYALFFWFVIDEYLWILIFANSLEQF